MDYIQQYSCTKKKNLLKAKLQSQLKHLNVNQIEREQATTTTSKNAKNLENTTVSPTTTNQPLTTGQPETTTTISSSNSSTTSLPTTTIQPTTTLPPK